MRQTPLDKAIEKLSAKIEALQEARELLVDQRASMRIPAKKPKPKPVTDAVAE